MIYYVDILIDWSIEPDDWTILSFSDIPEVQIYNSDSFIDSLEKIITLKNELCNWLNYSNVDYYTRIIQHDSENFFRIEFTKPEDLVLFKLTFI